MAAWSSIFRIAGQKILQNGGFKGALVKSEPARCMSEHRVMIVRTSRFQWEKLKDWAHFYILLGAIPVGIAITYINVFIGPATLQEIPEGYVPKEWEYHQHPIKRFFARHFFPSPQQEYEKFLHHVYNEYQVRKVRLLENKINDYQSKNRDYRGTFFREAYGSKYLYSYRKYLDEEHEP